MTDDAKLPLLVMTTVSTRDQALALGREMVERGLAACTQITAIESVYRWKGTVEHDTEFRLLLKTRADGYAALEAALRERHPYELPAIHAVATTRAEAAYAEWVHANAGRQQATPGADDAA
jgi:periplasmic divalent cation tolerance protein